MAVKVDKEITRELDRLRLGSMSEDIVKGGEFVRPECDLPSHSCPSHMLVS